MGFDWLLGAGCAPGHALQRLFCCGAYKIHTLHFSSFFVFLFFFQFVFAMQVLHARLSPGHAPGRNLLPNAIYFCVFYSRLRLATRPRTQQLPFWFWLIKFYAW